MGGLRPGVGTIAVLLLMAVSAAAQQTPSGQRAVEIAVETGWLADPITFPYDLRAFFKDGVLELHGVVPSTIVRKQVVNIAKLHAKNVADHTEIVPGRLKAYVNLPSETVIAGARAVIARNLPQLQRSVDATSDADGRVVLTGAVPTSAEKQMAAELMRSVSGCMLVVNRIVVAGIGAAPEPMVAGATNDRTRVMTERISQAAPGAKNLVVYQTGPRHYQVSFSARNGVEAEQFVNRIFDLPESKQLRLDVNARVPTTP